MSAATEELAVKLGGVELSPRLQELCDAAEGELAGLLKPGLSPDGCGDAFPRAAAWLALAGLEQAGDTGVSAFTAGEVTIRRAGGGERSRQLRERALEILRPYLADRQFAFRTVRY